MLFEKVLSLLRDNKKTVIHEKKSNKEYTCFGRDNTIMLTEKVFGGIKIKKVKTITLDEILNGDWELGSIYK